MNESHVKLLGRSKIEVSALGMGCWAIGGPFTNPKGKACGWGHVNDDESIQAIKRAIELGINFFETSDVYGAGHSESILGQAFSGTRDKVVIGTKFGYVFDLNTKQYTHADVSPAYIRKACEASLRRLHTDYIDLYQLHVGELAPEEAQRVVEALDTLRQDGLIRTYGCSTDNVQLAKVFAKQEHCSSIEYKLNVFNDNVDMITLCEQENLVSTIRSPLSMGLLSGKYTQESLLPSNDVRGANNTSGFENGKPKPNMLAKLNAVREILTSNGRTLAQGALAWIWGHTSSAIPIPGFKNIQQVEENCKALEFGPLTEVQISEINMILNRF